MSESTSREVLHQRYEWLDQSRGLVSLLFIVAAIAYSMSGDPVLGTLPLGPTFLNHGYKYYGGAVPLITIIDLGQQIFMFVMGFVAYLAFTSRWKKRGNRSALRYGARRVIFLYALALGDALIEFQDHSPIRWNEVLYDSTLAKLAIGAFAAYTTTYLVRNANWRFLLGVGILATHAVVFASPFFNRHTYLDDTLALKYFPFAGANLAAVAIIATAFAQWVWTHPDGFPSAFRTRVAPISMYALIACWCINWFQPADHHDVTTSIALFSIGISGLMLTMCYGFDQLGIRFPLLTPWGKNLLFVFAVGGLTTDAYVGALDREFLQNSPFLAMLLAGVLPIGCLGAVLVLMDRKNIIIKV